MGLEPNFHPVLPLVSTLSQLFKPTVIYMVGLNHQQCKTIFTERFRLSPSSEFTGKKIKKYNISTGKSRKYKK